MASSFSNKLSSYSRSLLQTSRLRSQERGQCKQNPQSSFLQLPMPSKNRTRSSKVPLRTAEKNCESPHELWNMIKKLTSCVAQRLCAKWSLTFESSPLINYMAQTIALLQECCLHLRNSGQSVIRRRKASGPRFAKS